MSSDKRKNRWKKFSFESSENTFQSDVKQVSLSKEMNGVLPKKNFNFEKEITPKLLDDLAVHAKKISDVESWLNMHIITPIKKKSKMLLITGPTGCGKTITVKVLCKKLNIDVKEWVNPVDSKDKEFSMGQTNQLIEFTQSAKYPSLFSVNKPNIILIEDFPNSVIHNPSEFVAVLEKCYDNNSHMVFICTDGNSNLNLSYNLFTQEIKDKFSIYNINFNATAVTLLKKALKRAEKLIENHQDIFNIPNQDIVDTIINSCMGDIRCAVNQYYFASLQDNSIESIKKSRKSTLKRKRSDKNNMTKIESMMKTERLSFFHGLGRVLNPKREIVNNSWRIKCDINALVEELGIQPNTFNSFIHANYLKYFGDINDIRKAANILSVSQSYLSKWDYNPYLLKYGLWMTILGLMVFNEHKISKWNQINAPKKFNKSINNDIETRYLSASDKFYYNIIKKCDNHKFRLSC